MTLSKQQRHNDLDRYWMETVCIFYAESKAPSPDNLYIVLMLLYWCVSQLLCLVGESFDEASDEVCGAVVNVRPKGDKISIWTGNCQNRDAIMTIG